MKELIPTASGYTDNQGNGYRIIGGRLSGPPPTPTASVSTNPISSIANFFTTSIQFIQDLNAHGDLRRAQERNGQLQLVLDTYVEQNHQLDIQIVQGQELLRQAQGSLYGLGELGKWFCLFNCNKKIEEAREETNLTNRIEEERKAQLEKIGALQRIQGQMETILKGEASAQQASIIGWGTGILAASIIGGYLVQKHKERKSIKDKPVKKD